MRKITIDAINKFMANKPFKRDNTKVILSDGQTELWLYSTLIARCTNGKYYVTNGGYETNTTSERLRNLVRHYECGNVYIKQFNMYYEDSNKIVTTLDSNYFTQIR